MKYLLLALLISTAHAQQNTGIYIDEIGDNNTINITQDSSAEQFISIVMGKGSNVDNTIITVNQQDGGTKNAVIDLASGINNSVNISQQGTGNHSASIQNFIGSGNGITINQNGAGKHEFIVANDSSTTNNGNTITGNQSGGLGSDKWFKVYMNGATGATVNVLQNNAITPDAASMNVQCAAGTCGTFSYTKN